MRLSGQDSRRGTFSQRHSVLYDEENRQRFIPLNHLRPNQAKFCVYNSPLSEFAVLGFDYGYSMDFPAQLYLWEAQFGDFANGAQIIIDQFIAPSESKWRRPSAIVLLLPHGYEGQGPEHSSARLERFLQLCAEENMQVCNLTTPAQYFHVLRRQMHRKYRKPLIVMTPKSLLTHEQAVSKDHDFTNSRFFEILGDTEAAPKKVERVIFCSGKVYYDLIKYRQENNLKDAAAIVRIEQLYPLHKEKVSRLAKPFSQCEEICVVPGRAGKHGRMGVYLAAVAQSVPGLHPLRRAASERESGGRDDAGAPSPAGGIGQASLRNLKLPSFFMNVEVKVPTVGESITSGILSVWHKKDGESVNAGDILFTLETDKVSTEVNAPEAGHPKDPGCRRRRSQNRSGRRRHRAGLRSRAGGNACRACEGRTRRHEARRPGGRGSGRAAARVQAGSGSAEKRGSSRAETKDHGAR